MDNNKLQHWGIKGMKWGRRRWQNKDGSLTPAGRARYDDDEDDSPRGRSRGVHEDHVKAHAGKHVSEMSTKELQEWSNRRNLENQYREANMTKGDKFKRWLAKSAMDVGSQVAKDYARKALDSAVNMGLSKIGASSNSEGVKSFLQGMGIKWEKKPKVETPKPDNAQPKADDKAAKQQAKAEADTSTSSAKKSYEAPTADISPKMSKGVKKAFKDVRGGNNESETANNAKLKDDSADGKPNAGSSTGSRGGSGTLFDYEAENQSSGKQTRSEKKAEKKAAKNAARAEAEIDKQLDEYSQILNRSQSKPATASAKKPYESPDDDIKIPAREIGSGNLNDSQKSMMKALRASGGLTVAEIANAIGASPSTVSRYTAGSAPKKKKEEKD